MDIEAFWRDVQALTTDMLTPFVVWCIWTWIDPWKPEHGPTD